MNAKERIIVAVDVPTIRDEEVATTLRALAPHVGFFKVGLELISAGEGDAAIEAVGDPSKVMFDIKLHDIPNTVAGAVKRIASKGVGMFTLHASGSHAMMEAAAANCGDSVPLAVTVLTSMNEESCRLVYDRPPFVQVTGFALMAIEAGLDHVVCSAEDIPAILNAEGAHHRRLVKVTPGIRVDWGRGPQADDQARVLTPAKAVAAGADYLVIGRDIMQAEGRHRISPLEAVRRITEEIESVTVELDRRVPQ